MAVYVGSARIDENGKAYNGKAGDQNGKEVMTQKWYLSSKGWRVVRAKSREVALKIAQCMDAACKNSKIGYDQWQRHTLYNNAKAVGFDVSKVTKACETDCSALVRVCCAYAGITGIPESFRTGNMVDNLIKTGAFVELKGSKYTTQSAYLGLGDILITRTSGHTVVVLDDGPAYEGAINIPEKEPTLGDRLLKHGAEGSDVKTLQMYLVGLGYDVGKYGIDGDYGDSTELAVMAFQKDAGVEADGDYGPVTHAALMDAIEAKQNPVTGKNVRIEGGNCWVRKAPNTTGAKLGVANNGSVHPYQGQTNNGWLLIEYDGQNGWVSGKYGKVE